MGVAVLATNARSIPRDSCRFFDGTSLAPSRALMHPILIAAVFAALPSQPVREAEALLSAPKWPTHLSPKIALAYRLARAHAGREGRHWLIGSSVTQTGLRVTLRFSRDVKPSDVDA